MSKWNKLSGGWLVTLFTAALGFPVAGSSFAADYDESADVFRVTRILIELHNSSEAERPGVRERFLELGPQSIPALRSILSGQTPLPASSGPLLEEGAFALVDEALRAWPREDVLRHALAIDEAATTAERLLVLHWLASIGDSREFDAFMDLLESFGQAVLRHPRTAADVEGALQLLFERDSRALDVLSKRLAEIDVELQSSFARAVGRRSLNGGARLLERMLGRSVRLDAVVLDVLGNWDHGSPEFATEVCATSVRAKLDAPERRLRQEAAIAAGKLLDAEAVPDLIGLLTDPDRRVKEAATWALQSIGGAAAGRSPAAWEVWLEAERTWFAERAPDCLDTIREGEAGPAIAALGEAANHPLFRRDLVEGVAFGLVNSEENVALAACAALTRLADFGARDMLIDSLETAQDGRREAAGATLRVLTGTDLPAEAEAWRGHFGL